MEAITSDQPKHRVPLGKDAEMYLKWQAGMSEQNLLEFAKITDDDEYFAKFEVFAAR